MAFSTSQVRAIVKFVLTTGDASTGFAGPFEANSPYWNPPTTDTSLTAAALASQLAGFKQALAGLALSKQQQIAILATVSQSTTKPWSGLNNAARVAALQAVVWSLSVYVGADGNGNISQSSNLISGLAAAVQ